MTLIPDRPPREGLSPQVAYGSRVVVGTKSLDGGITVMAGFGGKDVGLADIGWDKSLKGLRPAFEANELEYVLVQVHCVEQR